MEIKRKLGQQDLHEKKPDFKAKIVTIYHAIYNGCRSEMCDNNSKKARQEGMRV